MTTQRQQQQALTKIVLIGMLLILFRTYYRESFALKGTTETAISSTTTATSTSNYDYNNRLQLAPGELPGYTGWARPESTLAGKFVVIDESKRVVTAGTTWHVTLQCHHQDCPHSSDIGETVQSSSWFYVRAYGPAIVTGIVVQQLQKSKRNQYRINIPFLDPGLYTVEVVLTFSVVPALDTFPLTNQKDVPNYEGYLVAGFPRQVQVVGNTVDEPVTYCSRDDLLLSSSETQQQDQQQYPATDLLHNGRWKVVDSNRWAAHTLILPTHNIHLAAYQKSYNSLGVKLVYERPNCRILEPRHHKKWWETCLATATATAVSNDSNNNSNAPILHFILIGDSTMRLQKDTLEAWWQTPIQQGRVKVTFVELYGGTLRCERLSGPRVSDLRRALAMSLSNDNSSSNNNNINDEQRVVLFNTGLHDIHRLCGTEWQSDRQQYLTPHELQISCMEVYRTAVLPTLVNAVLQLPATVRIFQTTTAAWPKYGNYGVAWNPARGQGLPLDAGFVEQFNRIAAEFLSPPPYQDKIQIVDGYWITLARPDNREIDKESNLSKKLSHPGAEVVQAMVRIWTHVMLRTICPSIFDNQH